jgi:Sec-independent protein translocase protein TatA
VNALLDSSSLSATILSWWELVLVMAVLLLSAKKLPGFFRGMGHGFSRFRQEVAGLAHEAGKSAGGIFGKPAAEALTPDNQTAELYDPAVSRRRGRRPVRQRLRNLWKRIGTWLNKHGWRVGFGKKG